MPDRQRSRSKIGTFGLLTATPSWAKAGHAASDPTVMKRSKSTLWGGIMMRSRRDSRRSIIRNSGLSSRPITFSSPTLADPCRLRSQDPPGGRELSEFLENSLQHNRPHHRSLHSDRRLLQHSTSPPAGDYCYCGVAPYITVAVFRSVIVLQLSVARW